MGISCTLYLCLNWREKAAWEKHSLVNTFINVFTSEIALSYPKKQGDQQRGCQRVSKLVINPTWKQKCYLNCCMHNALLSFALIQEIINWFTVLPNPCLSVPQFSVKIHPIFIVHIQESYRILSH